MQGEKLEYLKQRWEELPEELRTPNQISGRHLTHCGFITGASYCSFHCTHWYLPKHANEVPIPSLADMKETIDANRRLQGPGGGLQITGGDVADAYWRSGRPDELITIIQYAYAAGLVPMLMTHGQTLLEQPAFLERLVVEGGLRQISIHIDMTQAGRRGFPFQRVESEKDLHPLRAAFTLLIAGLRKKTGLPIELALSFTVTERNIEDVPEVIRWYLADPIKARLDACVFKGAVKEDGEWKAVPMCAMNQAKWSESLFLPTHRPNPPLSAAGGRPGVVESNTVFSLPSSSR